MSNPQDRQLDSLPPMAVEKSDRRREIKNEVFLTRLSIGVMKAHVYWIVAANSTLAEYRTAPEVPALFLRS